VTRIVVLGDVMVDVVARLSGPVAVASDSPSRISWGFGGSAANVAAWLVAAGGAPVLVGRVGDDPQGAAAAADLTAAGVDARLVVDPDRATGTCIVLVAPSGERSMLPDAGANDGLQADDLPDELLAAGRHLHVTGYALIRPGSRPAARAAIERAKSAGMTVSVDPSSAAILSAEFLDWADGADLLLPNADEAEALGGVRALTERFPELVVKLGAQGALWTDGRKEVRIRAAAAPAVDSTGAGDAFAAGLLYARINWAGVGEALASGRDLAARAVAGHGARPPKRA